MGRKLAALLSTTGRSCLFAFTKTLMRVGAVAAGPGGLVGLDDEGGGCGSSPSPTSAHGLSADRNNCESATVHACESKQQSGVRASEIKELHADLHFVIVVRSESVVVTMRGSTVKHSLPIDEQNLVH